MLLRDSGFNGIMFADAIAHVLAVVLISGAIFLVGAIVLHPTGQGIKTPAQLGELLAAGIDKTTRLESNFIKWGSLICIVITTAICFTYNGNRDTFRRILRNAAHLQEGHQRGKQYAPAESLAVLHAGELSLCAGHDWLINSENVRQVTRERYSANSCCTVLLSL